MSKIKIQNDILSQLQLAFNTGKCVVGFNTVIKSIIQNRAQCIAVSRNIPNTMCKKLEYYCALANNIPIKFVDGTKREFSALFGLKYNTCALAILDQGEAEIVQVAEN